MDNTVGSRQQDVIIGTLLGDGFLERDGKNVRLVMDHSSKQERYVRWKGSTLKDFSFTIAVKKRFDERTKRTYTNCVLRTRTSPLLEKYVDLFHGLSARKRVPVTLPALMNPQVLAVWIMDDGYRRNDCNAMRINSQSYSYREHSILQQSLMKLSIPSHIQRHKDTFVTYIPSKGMNALRLLVRQHIIPEMMYKIA